MKAYRLDLDSWPVRWVKASRKLRPAQRAWLSTVKGKEKHRLKQTLLEAKTG